ncbi:hypothetical protein FACS1894126_4580 [Alphaproteobacteria bacterium]|nr:hypothetical protein FACS1894126_4580 [Alphaproteobacteria bacterium]
MFYLLPMIFSTKSKTFLVGEYAVLFGGGAVVLTTDPEFKLTVEHSDCTFLVGINERSPAFSFFLNHVDVFRNLRISFIDPHNGTGGFGASSAQYVLLHQLYRKLTDTVWNFDSFLAEYRSYCGQSVGPSGADCIAQQENRHIYFKGTSNSIEHMDWNFRDLDFIIFKTGLKVETHTHLQQLPSIDVSSLNVIVENVRDSFIRNDSDMLIKNVMDFFCSLDKMGLVTDRTCSLVNQLLKTKEILAAKGCGAMAADTIIVIFAKKDREKILKVLERFSFWPNPNQLQKPVDLLWPQD